jgi:peptidoglycan/LPS O-acetylase OafA/YrhL
MKIRSLEEPGAGQSSSRLTMSPGMFRIFLAILVVFNHSIPLKLGPFAVYLFFMLSGYWCYRMWFSEYRHTNAPYRLFIASRIWRLLPVYLIALALLVAFRAWSHQSWPLSPASSLRHSVHFYFSNLFVVGLTRLQDEEMLLLPAWSLDLEIQFYFIAPLIILAVTSARAKLWRALLLAFSLLSAGYFLWRFEAYKSYHGFLPMYLIFFIIGIYTARYNWSPSKTTVYASLAATAAILIICLALDGTRGLLLLGGGIYDPIFYYNVAVNFAMALLLAPYAMATVAVKKRRGFLGRIDRDLSNLTYDVYLLHMVVLDAAASLFPDLDDADYPEQILYMVATYAMIGALAYAVYYVLDRPIDARRRRYIKSHRVQ